jgi:hypothetical protein
MEYRFDGCPVLDLFNKRTNAPYPGLEPIVTSRFWNIVASQPDIFGVFSGRTGSVDVAIFNGVNVLWWDEPWLSIAAREPDTMRWYGLFEPDPRHTGESKTFQNWTIEELTSSRHPRESTPLEQGARGWLANDRDQVDQCLRCLQMAAISSVCLVNPRQQPHLTVQQVEQRLEVGLLPWLAGTHDPRRDGRPPVPAQDPMVGRAYHWPNVTIPTPVNWMWWDPAGQGNKPRVERKVCLPQLPTYLTRHSLQPATPAPLPES